MREVDRLDGVIEYLLSLSRAGRRAARPTRSTSARRRARQLAREWGGEVTIANRGDGGARAVVVLPGDREAVPS